MARRSSLGLAGLVLLVFVSLAPAHEVAQHELLLFEEPKITAAGKYAQRAADAPSSVTVVGREEIRRFGWRTLAELLRAQRGFYAVDDRNYAYVGVRGFLRTGDYNDRILLLVNGHAYNDDVYQTALLGNEFGIDLEVVERVEIVRGPGSALYGGNALFAVVNVVTIDPTDAPRAEAGVETGSFDRKRARFTLSHAFESGLAVMGTGSVLDLDGHDLLAYRFPAPDGETDRVLSRGADAERAVNFFLSGRWRSFRFQGGANRREKTIPTGAFETVVGDRANETVDGRYFAEGGWTGFLPADVELDARAYYDGYRYHGTYVYADERGRTKLRDRSDSHWFGGELRGAKRVLDAHHLVFGLEASYHPSAEQSAEDAGENLFADDRSFGNYGAYLQDEWDVTTTIRLIGGGRFDHVYDDDGAISPRAGLVWRPRPDTAAKLLYGRAFRAPNLYERYYGDGTGNPRLDREWITTYEGVAEWQGDHLSIAATIFHYEVDELIDLLTQVDDAGEEFDRFENRDDARATGGEIELRYTLGGGLAGRVSYSHQRATISRRRAESSPRHLASAGLLFDLPYGIRGGAELLVVGRRRTSAGDSTGTAVIPNLTLVARTPIDGLDADLGLYNFLDQPYSDPGGVEHRQDRIPRDRFAFRAGLRYAWR